MAASMGLPGLALRKLQGFDCQAHLPHGSHKFIIAIALSQVGFMSTTLVLFVWYSVSFHRLMFDLCGRWLSMIM